MKPQYWSWILTAVGVFGLWLAGRKDRRGWMVGIGAQSLWIAYATATHQWGFYVSAVAYGWVYIKNARAWKAPAALSEGGDDMGFVKHGVGDVLPEPKEKKTAASKEWTESDQRELSAENDQADKEQG